MGRVKGRYEGKLTITIDSPSNLKKGTPIADIRKWLRKIFAKDLREELQIQLDGMGTVELEEQHLDVYEVTE